MFPIIAIISEIEFGKMCELHHIKIQNKYFCDSWLIYDTWTVLTIITTFSYFFRVSAISFYLRAGMHLHVYVMVFKLKKE